MGDLNMGPRRADRLTGLGALATGPTFPADAPTRQIDHLLGRGVAGTGGPVRLRRLRPPSPGHRGLAGHEQLDPAGMHGGVELVRGDLTTSGRGAVRG